MNRRKPNKKNLIWFSVLAALVVIGIVAGIVLLGNQQGYRTITVFETEGNVSVVNNGIEYKAYPGMVLQEGYAVVTSANSYVRMVLDGDKYVKLESGSRATFETLGVLGSGKTRIQLERGVLTSEIVNPLEADEEFVVNTANAVLAVRGTFFRVELQVTNKGEVRTDVYTYGGKVASQRILPTGEQVEEEVLVDAGYKATVSMTEQDTVYLTQNVITDEKQEKSITPIVLEDISDEDLVDMYFASDNGHELFVPMVELEKLVEDRSIEIEEYTSPYKKAEETGNENVVATTPDDNRPLVPEETEVEEAAEQIAGAPTDGGSTEEKIPEKDETIDVALGEETEEDGRETLVEESDIMLEEQPAEEPETPEPEEVPDTPEDEEDSGNTDETPEHVHTEVTNTVDATCTQPGKTTVSCSSCGTILSGTAIPATGHSYGSWNIVTAATCEVEGAQERTCSICSDKETKTIVALGHDYAADLTVDVEATCTDVGSKSKHCSRCDATTEVTEIAASGHSYGNWNITTEASCEDMGTQERSCNVCSEAETETIAALGHDYAMDFTVDVEATCTDVGSKSKHCSRCDATTEVTEIVATGHSITYVGTADVHGTCDICGTDMTEHDYMDVTMEATCTTEGETTYTCNCGHSYTEAIPMLAHTEATEYTDGTETADGLMRVYCSVCNNTIEEETLFSIPKNFPDDVFAAYVTSNFDTDGHSSLNTTELANLQAATTVNVAGTSTTDGGVSSLAGIEHFTALRTLNCSYNTGLTALDTSGNAELRNMYCSGTDIVALDVSQNTKLDYLWCDDTNLTALDVSQNTSLDSLNCANTAIADLDLTSNTYISSLDVTNCTALTSLNLNGVSWFNSGLDLTTCSGLQELGLESTGITELDLSGNPALRSLNVNGTSISTLDTSNNTELETLLCTGCYNLTTLDLSNNTKLQEVDVSYTYITAVNFSANTELTTVKAKDARINTLDLSACNNVTTVEVSGDIQAINVNDATGLTALDISGCSMLWELQFQNTGITAMDLSAMGSLQTVNGSGSGVMDITISSSSLQTVDFSNCTSLVSLSADADYGYNFTGLDVSGCTALTTLDACGSFTDLDLSSCTNLTTLTLDSCGSLTALDLSRNTNLATLSLVGYFSQLRTLNVTGTKITSLDVSTTSLTEVNVSGLTTLTQLNPNQSCSIINASNCTNLTRIENLSIMYNVRELYLDKTQIAEVSLTGTSLEKLVLSNNTAVTNVELYDLYSFNTLEIDGCTSLSSLSLINISATMTIDATTCTSLTEYDVNKTGSDNITVNYAP